MLMLMQLACGNRWLANAAEPHTNGVSNSTKTRGQGIGPDNLISTVTFPFATHVRLYHDRNRGKSWGMSHCCSRATSSAKKNKYNSKSDNKQRWTTQVGIEREREMKEQALFTLKFNTVKQNRHSKKLNQPWLQYAGIKTVITWDFNRRHCYTISISSLGRVLTLIWNVMAVSDHPCSWIDLHTESLTQINLSKLFNKVEFSATRFFSNIY